MLNPDKDSRAIFRAATGADAELVLTFIGELAAYAGQSDAVSITLADVERDFFTGHPKAHALLAEIDGHAVGFAAYFHTYATYKGKCGLHIEDIYVRDAYRGRGIGKRFFNEFARMAMEKDYSRITWLALERNKPALGFYESLGAQGERIGYRLEGARLQQIADKAAP